MEQEEVADERNGMQVWSRSVGPLHGVPEGALLPLRMREVQAASRQGDAPMMFLAVLIFMQFSTFAVAWIVTDVILTIQDGWRNG